MGIDLVAFGMIDVDKKLVFKMKKIWQECQKKNLELEQCPKELQDFSDKYMPSTWDMSDPEFLPGLVDIEYDINYDEDEDCIIDLSKLPKNVKKIKVSMC